MEGIHEDHPKTKYIYVSGHSKLTPDMDYIGPFEQIKFVNLVEPDTFLAAFNAFKPELI